MYDFKQLQNSYRQLFHVVKIMKVYLGGSRYRGHQALEYASVMQMMNIIINNYHYLVSTLNIIIFIDYNIEFMLIRLRYINRERKRERDNLIVI